MSKITISRRLYAGYMTHMDVVMAGNFPFVEPCVALARKIELEPFIKNGDVCLDDIKDQLDMAENCEALLMHTGWMENHKSFCDGTEYIVDEENIINIGMDVLRYLVGSGVKYVIVDSPGVRGGRAGEMHNEGDIFLVENKMYAVEYVGGLNQVPEVSRICMSPYDVNPSENILRLKIECEV